MVRSGSRPVSLLTAKCPLNWPNKATEFVLQQNRSYSSYAITLTFSFKTGKVLGLIFGTEESLSELFDYLDCISPLPFGPTIIPTAALELQAKRFNENIKSCHDQIFEIETLTGMRQFNHAHELNAARTLDWKTLNLIDITRNLSGLLSRLAHLKLQAETGGYLIQQIQLCAEFLRVELERKKVEKSKVDSQLACLSKLNHNRSWYIGLDARCRYLTERTQAQIQTVRPTKQLDD